MDVPSDEAPACAGMMRWRIAALGLLAFFKNSCGLQVLEEFGVDL